MVACGDSEIEWLPLAEYQSPFTRKLRNYASAGLLARPLSTAFPFNKEKWLYD
jgi:hypothetical protein